MKNKRTGSGDPLRDGLLGGCDGLSCYYSTGKDRGQGDIILGPKGLRIVHREREFPNY